MLDSSSTRAEFIQHLQSTSPEGSGKATSYARALDILDELIKEGKVQVPFSVWLLRDPSMLENMDAYVIQQQNDPNGIFKDKPESYWKKGFVSAALRQFKLFVEVQFAKRTRANMDSPHQKTSILSKPFLILAGISGTGKTRWVRKIAEATRDRRSDREGKPSQDNLCLIPVRPDWHEPSDLLGFTSRISGKPEFVQTPFLSFLMAAWKNAWKVQPKLETLMASVSSMTPHWVCLDEMNLAPVEQYFADYLSVVESRSWDGGIYACDPLFSFEGRSDEELTSIKNALLGLDSNESALLLWDAFCDAAKPGIPLPPNLIVVGTVNMDETTHAFSRKVLDRAFTVEFDAFSAEQYRSGADVDPVLGVDLTEGVEMPASVVLSTWTSGTGVTGIVAEKVDAMIDSWNTLMDETPFRVAYRTLNEALLFAASKGEERIAEAMDGILMMKLLPRLEGDTDKLGYDGNETLIADAELDKVPNAKDSLVHAAWQVAKVAIGSEAWMASKSRRKLLYMAKRLSRTGYTSFWP